MVRTIVFKLRAIMGVFDEKSSCQLIQPLWTVSMVGWTSNKKHSNEWFHREPSRIQFRCGQGMIPTISNERPGMVDRELDQGDVHLEGKQWESLNSIGMKAVENSSFCILLMIYGYLWRIGKKWESCVLWKSWYVVMTASPQQNLPAPKHHQLTGWTTLVQSLRIRRESATSHATNGCRDV